MAVTTTLKPIFVPLFSKNMQPWKIQWMPFWKPKEPIKIQFDKADIISFIISVGIGTWYALTNHWISNNILGLCFSIQGVAFISLGSYKVGCILLGGLFFYDIFWVFGTDVMVTVAKSFDAPIKLLFPKALYADPLQFSMLGLGDIVIPGIFVALLLRFDMKRSLKSDLSKLYFWSCFLFYTIGLLLTIGVMHFFQAAQPALLYLVPACIGNSFILAISRGELNALLSYDESQNDKKEDKKEDKKDT